MKRHPALQDLSRDHFVALNAVVDVRRVVEADSFSKRLQPVWDGFLTLCRTVLPSHFAEEEELLLPCLGSPSREAHAARLREEHDRLRQSFDDLMQAPPDAQRLWRVAQDLRAHIRWEEDELFERLQEWLSDQELDALAAKNSTFRVQAGLPVGSGHARS